MITLNHTHPAEPNDRPAVLGLAVALAVAGSVTYLLLIWGALRFGMI